MIFYFRRSMTWPGKLMVLLMGLIFPLLFSCSSRPPVPPPTPVDTLGAGWRKISLPELFFNDIFFINNNTGYVVGNGTIFKSTDGGSNWQQIHQSTSGIINIAMGSESNVIFVGGGRLLYTKNGGSSFDSVTLIDLIEDAFFVNATTVYAVGQKVWKSTNAGSTWTNIYDLPASATGHKSLQFLNEQYGWLACKNGPYKTINGGVTWEQKTVPDFNFSIGSVYFTDTDNGYVSDGRYISKTPNGGNTWSRVFTGGGYHYQDIHFISTNLGYTLDGNRIYKTTNAGSAWTKEVVLVNNTLIDLHFTDASHGWACGVNVVLKYQN